MLTATARAPITLGVSLKMYFGHARTLEWTRAVVELAGRHPAVLSGAVELFIMPSFPAIVPVAALVADTPILVGAQDVAATGFGAYTGEVAAAELAEVGCRLVEIGHAERRRLCGEDDALIAAKVAVSIEAGLTPLVCVGETDRGAGADAVHEVTRRLDAALSTADAAPIVVAYEPVWAIGAAEPAPDEHIVAVLDGIRHHLDRSAERAGSRVIYGGSAGPGLLTRNAGRVRGLFLGRFVHDPANLARVLDEAAQLADDPGAGI